MTGYDSSISSGRGRHSVRSGGDLTGTLTTWTQSLTSQIMAEMAKRRVSNRAMDLYTNDAMAHGLLESLTVEAVGIGLTPVFNPDFDWLGFSPEWGEDYIRQAGKLFERWGMDWRMFADAPGRMTIYGLQALGYFSWRLDGLGLFQVIYKDIKGSPLPIALLPIDSWRLATPSMRTKAEIYDGIEIDRDGRPVKAWIRKAGKPALSREVGNYEEFDVWDKETGLPRLLMVCDVRNVAEYRQDSILGSMIKEIRDNNDFVDAALVRALMNNMIVAFIQNAHGLSRSSKDTDPNRIVEFDKGTILQGFPNEIPHFFNNDAPGPNFEAMMGSIVKRLGMATGRGPENVSREYNKSYSASKASMAKAQQFNAAEHSQVLGPRFNQPMAAWMLYAGVLKGIIPAKSVQHFKENLYDYCRTEWLPQPVVEIDRQKAAAADKIELTETHTSTYEDIYGQRNANWKTKLRQKAKELQYIHDLEEEFGVSFKAAPTTEKENDDDPDAPHGDDSTDE